MRHSARLNSRHMHAAIALLGLGLTLAATAFAQLASRPAEEWLKVLESEERIAGLKAPEVVASLKLNPGDVVADLGAGGGPFVVPFARAVPNGRVYAVDIDRNFFPHIEKRAKAAGASNVQTVLGQFTDPKLPTSDVDVAFMHDVLHHVEDRAAYLKSVAKYLKPGGRIAIIDYHPAQSPHKDDAALVITREQAAAWLADAGFKPADDLAMFSEKWFIVFVKPR